MATYIGIDISKHSLDIYTSETKQVHSFANDLRGINRLIKYLRSTSQNIGCVTCEATGGYERLMVKELQGAKIPVHVAHRNDPRKVDQSQRDNFMLEN